MNRIYKSIYNAARRCVVCVSEIQSSRVKSKSESKATPVKPILSMLSAAVLVATSSHAMAAPDPANLIQVGGIYYQYDADGKCTVYEPYETSKAINWNYTFSDDPEKTFLDMTATDKTLYSALADGGTGSLTIKEGMTVTIAGGTSRGAYAFDMLATNGGSAEIINEGTLTIQGGAVFNANGIGSNAYYSGIGTISNTGTGKLTIQGGTGDDAHGIYTNAYGTGSTGTIQNLGSGVLTIQSASSEGIQYNAYSGGTGNIINEGDGELIIKAISSFSAIAKNASGTGSKGVIANTGKGKLTIQGSETTEGGMAIGHMANEYSSGLISNTGEGTLIIQGGSVRNSFGIFVLSSDAEGIISNSGSGDMFIQGGTSKYAHGIDSMFQGTWSKNELRSQKRNFESILYNTI